MDRSRIFATGVLISTLLLAADSSAATKVGLTVTPSTVMASESVQVNGITPVACKPMSRVLIYSSAFVGKPVYDGWEGVFVTSNAQRAFSVNATTNKTDLAGSWGIFGLCSGHKFGDVDVNITTYNAAAAGTTTTLSTKHKKPKPTGNPSTNEPTWWIPNPCQVTPNSILDFAGATRRNYTLTWSQRDTPQATATCQWSSSVKQEAVTFYVGNLVPSLPTGLATVSAISGWPGAKLRASELLISNANWFYTVTFYRLFQGHEVYGMYVWKGASCTSAQPHAAAALLPIYNAFGPPGVTVPARQPVGPGGLGWLCQPTWKSNVQSVRSPQSEHDR